jgi:SAM-dependent methyltransferase
MPTFHDRDPSAPGFWDERFQQHFTPWDRGGVPAALRQFVAQAAAPLTILIPGCGSAYEAGYLCDAGWDVTAIDFSPAAVAAAKKVLGPHGSRVLEADFFTFEPQQPLDLIYERAFLCALPRDMWPRIVQRWADLLPADALLAGFFFFDDAPKGPPFGANRGELEAMLGLHFRQIDDQEVTDSIAVFAGKERWQVWRRLA